MSTLNCDKKKLPEPPAWTCALPEDDYHAASASGNMLSAGMLREFRQCPAHYHSLICGAVKKKDGDSLRFGRAVHKMFLEGAAAFYASYVVGGPVNEKTGRSYGSGSKAFERWMRDCGLESRRVVTPSEFEGMTRMLASARAHREVARLFDGGWPERTARVEMHGMRCQIRMDWLRDDGVVVDVKTTADIARFEGDARRFGYLHQFAFYRDAVKAAGGGDVELAAVVLEKREPFRAGVWFFAADVLEPYSAQNRGAMASLRRCREENRWPTGYEAARSYPLAGVPPFWLN